MSELGEIIRQRRKELKLTQSDLANMVGVTRSTITIWECDGNVPSTKNLTALEKALEFPVGTLAIFVSYACRHSTDQ